MSATPPLSLFEAVERGEAGAMNQLIAAWLPMVIAWCGRLGGPKINREDAAHDVMIVVIKRHQKVDGASKFPAWLFSVTRNIISRHRRKAWLRRWVPGDVPDAADPISTRRPEFSDTARWVWEVLEELPDAQREALILCDLEGRTREEAAELLAVPVGTVKGRLRLGRKRFRKLAHVRGYVTSSVEVGG
ncbi:MAG: sigma-70 family RNA polymerase sigma factor [Myxococcota bacterium]